ncbi:MAG: hypothetical protein LBR54_04665 [Oscillospiraceae bacterium]|nr:hypothetical protein [Oscillospiraceae bacterium]
MQYTIELLSMTHAKKAQTLLSSKGYTCSVKKVTNKNGCSFYLYTKDDINKMEKILLENGIVFKRV